MKTIGSPRLHHDLPFLSTRYAADLTLGKERKPDAQNNCYAGRTSRYADMLTQFRCLFHNAGSALRRQPTNAKPCENCAAGKNAPVNEKRLHSSFRPCNATSQNDSLVFFQKLFFGTRCI